VHPGGNPKRRNPREVAMFGTKSRKRQATQVAEDAWDNLRSLVGTAGDSARHAGRKTAGIASTTGNAVTSAADEAWWRATAAYDALAGRRPSTPWTWIAVAVGAGALAGYLAATAGVRVARVAVDRINRTDEEDDELGLSPAPVEPATPSRVV
jgi:hypothetical protein